MGNLRSKINNVKYYINMFSDWEATKQIIDENKSLYMIKKKDSDYQKVCLYTDGYFMCVYGDYGCYTFNQMTWKGDVHNLFYDNIGYQFEKLSTDSKRSVIIFDENKCKNDIYTWIKERLENHFDLEEEIIETVLNFMKEVDYFESELNELCEENCVVEIQPFLEFSFDLLHSIERDGFSLIMFLRENAHRLDEFDEVSESDLWHSGETIYQGYFVSLLALQICGEKLSKNIDTN